jgi:Inner membrane component of T3SS, cytoplasmic domain
MTGAEMSDEGRLFLEACGASGPLRFEVTDPAAAEVQTREIEKAALVVGRDAAADLVLDDADVEPFHAFLQVVDGRLLALDLGSASGLRWGEIPRAAGWVNRGQRLQIGRHTIRLVGGDREGGESIVEPAPTSSRYISRLSLPDVALEFRVASEGRNGSRQREVMDRVLLLGGRSERCRIRFDNRNPARFICTFLRTPTGVWMTNAQPAGGARVNGAFCRFTRLEDDDEVQLGHLRMRIMYNASANAMLVRPPSAQASASLGLTNQPRAIGGTVIPGDDSGSELLLQPFLEQAGTELGLPSSPFGQALVLLMRLVGNVHRDHLSIVRDELAEIRRLSQAMDKLRGEMQQPEPKHIPLPHAAPSNGTNHAAAPRTQPEHQPEPEPDEAPRPSPEAVKEIIGERLEAWERERQSRWRKLLNLLTQS